MLTMMMMMQKSLKIRRPVEGDFDTIRELAENCDYPIPYDFAHAAIIVENDKNIVGVGFIKYIAEATIVCTGSARQRIESMDLLLEQAIDDLTECNTDQLYIFVHDDKFERIVKKRWNFRDTVGKFLVRDIE